MQTAALHEWLQQELQRAPVLGRSSQPGALILQLVRRAILEGVMTPGVRVPSSRVGDIALLPVWIGGTTAIGLAKAPMDDTAYTYYYIDGRRTTRDSRGIIVTNGRKFVSK